MIKIGSTDISKIYVGSDEVTKAYVGSTLVYENNTDYSKIPLTIKVISGGTLELNANGNISRSVEYSINDGAWTSGTFASGASGSGFLLKSGDIVKFRGNNSAYGTNSSTYCYFSGVNIKFNVYGNIMSLIDDTEYTSVVTLSQSYTFEGLFKNCSGLVSAENLVLPATTLSYWCYQQMFYGCTSLTTAPELPATTLELYCYQYMFYNCRSLTTAPELPATTLATGCYYAMFLQCSSLTTAPELPATTLANSCYNSMFSTCNSLNYIKCLATDISASQCLNSWVSSVAATGTFVKNPSMNDWTTGVSGIPSGWTVQDA